jgi:hypothetical protein
MKRCWSLIVPLAGLILFSLITYNSFRRDREWHGHRPHRYFYWSSVRLDSDPLNRHPRTTAITPCKSEAEDCVVFDPLYIWISPGWPHRLLEISALPAFAIGAAIVGVLARAGISAVMSFLIAMPLLIGTWFYLVGWLIDRRRLRSRG